MNKLLLLFCFMITFATLTKVIAQPSITPASGYTWVKTGTNTYSSGQVSSTPTVAAGQNTSFSLPDSDPADCSSLCGGICDAPSQFIGKKAFGSSAHNSSACEQRAHSLAHWNNTNPASSIANGANSGTVHIPTAAELQIVQGTPGTGGGGSTNHGYIIGGNGGGCCSSKFSVTVNWGLTWSSAAFGGIAGGSPVFTTTGTFEGTDAGGSNSYLVGEWWGGGFGQSVGAIYPVSIASLPQNGSTFEMVYSGNSNIGISRIYGAADGEGVHSPGLEGRAVHTVTYDVWQIQAVLPLTLIDFDAKSYNNGAKINFTTASEANLRGFEIEKSNDGEQWINIGSVAAKNNLATNHYTFIDENETSSNTYYRLKINENDGKESFSKVLMLRKKGSIKNVALFPNPVAELLNLTIDTDKKHENVSLQIHNAVGQSMGVRQLSLLKGEQSILINTEQLTKDVYLVTLTFDDGSPVVVRNFVKN